MTQFIPFQYDGLAHAVILTLGAAVAGLIGLRRHRLANHGPALTWTAGLTVVALLGYEVQILFRQAAEKGKSEACYSNLRVMGVAISKYVQVKGRYPDANLWRDEIGLYLSGEDAATIFRCPGSSSTSYYAYNPAMSSISTERIERPADTVVLSDSRVDGIGGASDVDRNRHIGGCFLLMADGKPRWWSVRNTPRDITWTP